MEQPIGCYLFKLLSESVLTTHALGIFGNRSLLIDKISCNFFFGGDETILKFPIFYNRVFTPLTIKEVFAFLSDLVWGFSTWYVWAVCSRREVEYGFVLVTNGHHLLPFRGRWSEWGDMYQVHRMRAWDSGGWLICWLRRAEEGFCCQWDLRLEEHILSAFEWWRKNGINWGESRSSGMRRHGGTWGIAHDDKFTNLECDRIYWRAFTQFPDEDLRTASEYNDACLGGFSWLPEGVYTTSTLEDSHRSPRTAPVFCYL